MTKIRILSPAEHKAFQRPPLFQPDERKIYFEITKSVKKILKGKRTSLRKVGFLLQWGYFRRAGRFFSPSLFYKQDIIFVSQSLGLDHRTIKLAMYKEHRLIKDQQKILAILGFRLFEDHAEAEGLLSEEIRRLVAKQIRPKMIVYYLSHFFFQKKIVMPSYHKLAEAILQATDHFEAQLLLILEKNFTKPQRQRLDQLLIKVDQKILKKEGNYQSTPLVSLREFPLSARPKKIKKSIDDYLTIKSLFESLENILKLLSLAPVSLKYYAVWVQKAKISQLLQINNLHKRYLYLLAFIGHQYYYRQDLLVDTLLQSVQSALNRVQKQQDEQDKNNKKEKEQATYLLSLSYRDKTELLTKIHSVVNADDLSAEEKIAEIKQMIGKENGMDPSVIACIETLDRQVNNALNNVDYYHALEKQSLRLQNRLSLIIKNLAFNALNSKSSLLKAITYFKEQGTKIGNEAPCDFLTQRDRAHLFDGKGKIRPSLYKTLLFVKIADAIKSGEINLLHSYRYLSIDEYLINKTDWQHNKKNYLNRAELTSYLSAKKTIEPLQKKLEQQYQKINESIENGTNPHISFNKKNEIIIDTPKVEKIETQRIAELLKQKNYISILDLLSTVDHITHFSESLQHYSVVQQIKRPEPIVFYAGLIGKGCNIGLGKLASVSKGINGNTLETVVNWYFSNDHLMAANQRIIDVINKLALPDMMKKTLGKLHTSSDGQKRNVDQDSILANFSFKYHGSGRGVSIYDFIDERHVLFHSLVMSSSEREAAYVIDGLMCNDEIKSDIHSTDTHGYSDLIFAITYLLGIAFAPRLAKLKKRSLYSMESKKTYQQKGYTVLPDYTINMSLIEASWDDILRLVSTIKLKESTASQILKRLSSYAKENPLYQGLKEFGKLIKSIFILTYFNDLELRQAIQKQLNKIELANKFSDAVFFDNNQEFKQGSREEQEIAMSCKILLQNAIVLWNYLYLSQLLAEAEEPSKMNELLLTIKNGSIMTWLHINLLGEYDFRNKSASNEQLFDMDKILAWSLSSN